MLQGTYCSSCCCSLLTDSLAHSLSLSAFVCVSRALSPSFPRCLPLSLSLPPSLCMLYHDYAHLQDTSSINTYRQIQVVVVERHGELLNPRVRKHGLIVSLGRAPSYEASFNLNCLNELPSIRKGHGAYTRILEATITSSPYTSICPSSIGPWYP